MAVALATLPLNRRLAGDGDTFLAATTGAAGADGFTADLVVGRLLAAVLATGFFGATLAAEAFPAATFFATTFFAAAGFGASAFLGVANFFATTAFFGATTFFATAALFGALFFATDFFATGFFADAAFTACGFVTDFDTAGFALDFTAFAGLAGLADALPDALPDAGFGFATGLITERPALAGVLLACFKAFPFASVVFDATVLAVFVLFEALFFCALALELPVVFAISLHRGWPWRPGVIAHVSFTSKPGSGILATLHPSVPFRQRESSDSIDTVVAPFVQALDQSIAWTPVPLLPELLGLCTDCGDSLWSMARQSARWLAIAALPAVVPRRRGPGPRTLSLSALSLRR